MTINEWMLLLLTCLAGAASPGPSLALLMRSAIIDGRPAGVIFSIAHGAGILMYACLAVTGLETILSILPDPFYSSNSWLWFFLGGFQDYSRQPDKTNPNLHQTPLNLS